MRTAQVLAALALSPALAHAVVLVAIDGTAAVMNMGDEFLCVTFDWWPENKCDYGVCPWEKSGTPFVDLDSPRLRSALAGLGPVTLRIGGTPQDNITYAVGVDADGACPGYSPAPPALGNNFTGGCLTQERWDLLAGDFCGPSTECRLVFGVSVLNGRDRYPQMWEYPCPGDWNSSNAKALIDYSAAQGYALWGFELGNEVGCLSAEQYAADVATLAGLVKGAYGSDPAALPRIIATDQIGWGPDFFETFVGLVGGVVDVITWHEYPLSPGYNNPALDKNIVRPRPNFTAPWLRHHY